MGKVKEFVKNNPIKMAAGAVAVAAGVLWFFSRRKKKNDKEKKV